MTKKKKKKKIVKTDLLDARVYKYIHACMYYNYKYILDAKMYVYMQQRLRERSEMYRMRIAKSETERRMWF